MPVNFKPASPSAVISLTPDEPVIVTFNGTRNSQVASGSMELGFEFRDFTGALSDPAFVFVLVGNSAGVSNPSAVRDSAGVYHLTLDTSDISGRWPYYIRGDMATARGEFLVI